MGAKNSREISSESLKKFKEVLSEVINVFVSINYYPQYQSHYHYSNSNAKSKLFFVVIYGIQKDIIPGEAKSVIQGLLKGMGAAHLTPTGFLMATHVLERFETVSTNIDKFLRVMDEIWHLAEHIKKLR